MADGNVGQEENEQYVINYKNNVDYEGIFGVEDFITHK